MKRLMVLITFVLLFAALVICKDDANTLPSSTIKLQAISQNDRNEIGKTFTVCGSGKNGWDINCDDDPHPRTSVSITERKVYGYWVGTTGNYAKDFPRYRTEKLSTDTPDGRELSITYWISFTYLGVKDAPFIDFSYHDTHYIYQTVYGCFETHVGECPYPDEDATDIWQRVIRGVAAERKDINKDGKFSVLDLIALVVAYHKIQRLGS